MRVQIRANQRMWNMRSYPRPPRSYLTANTNAGDTVGIRDYRSNCVNLCDDASDIYEPGPRAARPPPPRSPCCGRAPASGLDAGGTGYLTANTNAGDTVGIRDYRSNCVNLCDDASDIYEPGPRAARPPPPRSPCCGRAPASGLDAGGTGRHRGVRTVGISVLRAFKPFRPPPRVSHSAGRRKSDLASTRTNPTARFPTPQSDR